MGENPRKGPPPTPILALFSEVRPKQTNAEQI